MSTWHYYDEKGEKVTVTGGQLKGLAKAGRITPDTIIETEDGKTAPARKIKGLTFLEATPTDTPPLEATESKTLPPQPAPEVAPETTAVPKEESVPPAASQESFLSKAYANAKIAAAIVAEQATITSVQS